MSTFWMVFFCLFFKINCRFLAMTALELLILHITVGNKLNSKKRTPYTPSLCNIRKFNSIPKTSCFVQWMSTRAHVHLWIGWILKATAIQPVSQPASRTSFDKCIIENGQFTEKFNLFLKLYTQMVTTTKNQMRTQPIECSHAIYSAENFQLDKIYGQMCEFISLSLHLHSLSLTLSIWFLFLYIFFLLG